MEIKKNNIFFYKKTLNREFKSLRQVKKFFKFKFNKLYLNTNSFSFCIFDAVKNNTKFKIYIPYNSNSYYVFFKQDKKQIDLRILLKFIKTLKI